MSRQLNPALDGAIEYLAMQWMMPNRMGNNGNWTGGPEMVVQDMFNYTFKDEFDYVQERIMDSLRSKDRDPFVKATSGVFKPRHEKTLASLLKAKLAIDLDGGHIKGKIGSTIIDTRILGLHTIEVEAPWSIRRRKRFGIPKTPETRELMLKLVPHYWNIYSGEHDERIADSGVADALPEGVHGMPVGATNTRLSNETALLMADACVDNLDEGAGAAVVQGRDGAQPTDPDTVTSGTNLFTLVCSDPAFGNAADGTPGGVATASAITDDSSADATGTLGYCRASSTADGATPADDHIDGEAGTSGADWNFNTLSIVSGSTVSGTSWTLTVPES